MHRVRKVAVVVGLVLLITGVAVLWPSVAIASYYSMVYNFAASTYDGATVAIQTTYHSTYLNNTGTIKGAISTNNDLTQVGWRYYPGYSSPKVFYRLYNYETSQVYDVDYGYINWSSLHTYKVVNDSPWADNVYDYYYDGTLLGYSFTPDAWQSQRWYVGGIKSQNDDRLLARFGGINVQDFALRLVDTSDPVIWSKNRVNYQRHNSTAFKPVYFYENYCDLRVESKLFP